MTEDHSLSAAALENLSHMHQESGVNVQTALSETPATTYTPIRKGMRDSKWVGLLTQTLACFYKGMSWNLMDLELM